MSDASPCTADPGALGLDSDRVAAVLAAAREYVTAGELPSAQIAIARRGKLAAVGTYGRYRTAGCDRTATADTLYMGFSTVKAVVASAVWLLFQDGKLELDQPVAELIPEFATNGKDDVRIEHLLTHTAGFPRAPFAPLDWADRTKRLARFASWWLEWRPGSRFEYHPTSTMWVVAELIERCTDMDYRSYLLNHVITPLGLRQLHIGLAPDLDAHVADVEPVGRAARPQRAGTGLQMPPELGVDEALIERYNSPQYRGIGVPGGGAVMNAASLALFYQALLRNTSGRDDHRLWTAQTLQTALTVRTGDMIDPMTGKRANRALGVVVAGDQERVFRGFGSTNSPLAFGHSGIGGQVGWGDPATGISFAFLTSGFDRNPVRAGVRAVSLSTQAADCSVTAGGRDPTAAA